MDNMNITNARYTSFDGSNNTGIKATIDGVEIDIPINAPGNRHYDEIMRQVDAGELTIADAE